MTSKPHTEKTSASGTIAGFDFQYYYFLYKLLILKKNETIGFELLDDVHTQLDNNHQVLIQVKHTVQKKSDGSPPNLTELDDDLWKTIGNWISVITDKNDNRDSQFSQLDFVSKTTFMLASNKSFNTSNAFLVKLTEFQHGNIDFQHLINYLESLHESTSSDDTKRNIASVVSLDVAISEGFLKKIRMELEIGDIIQQCKTAIEEKDVNPKEIEALFNQLDSVVRQDIFKNFSNQNKLVYSFEERKRKFRRYFDIANNPNLKIREFDGNLPDSLEQQTFIKQLLDIEDVDIGEEDIIEEFTRFRLMLESNLSKWVSQGELTSEEVREFEKDISRLWKTEYRALYRNNSNPDEYVDVAHRLLKEMRDKELSISGQKLLSDMRYGSLYSLSNKPVIGWLKDWEERYK